MKNYLRHIVLVGPLPQSGKLYYGQSVSFQMLIEGICEQNIPYSVIDLSGINTLPNSLPSLRRALEYVHILFQYFLKTALGKKTVYIGIARSRYGFFRDFIMIWFAWIKGHKIICHVKGGDYDKFYAAQPSYLQYLIRQTLLRVDAILVLGERLRSMYSFETRLKDKVNVVPNGLPLREYQKPISKTLPNSINKPIRILYLSNLVESKGYLDVLEAVRILVEEYAIRIECNFCGAFLANSADDVKVKSPEHGRALFENFVKEHKLSENIVYKGVVFGKEKIKLLKNSHFFILPTNYNTEGQPVSIIEAMAYGNVVVSTNYRAIPDMVIDKKTGYLVNYGSSDQIAQVIADTVANPRKYYEMSQAAIAHFQENFTRKAHLKQILPFLTKSE